MVKYTADGFPAMGSNVSLNYKSSNTLMHYEVRMLFKDYEQVASRFIPDNDLDRVNSNLKQWVECSPVLVAMIKAAYDAYQYTHGSFDPRILNQLKNAGYVYNFNDNNWEENKTKSIMITKKWQPLFSDDAVFIGDMPIDLGGIGKSYTAMQAAKILDEHSENYFVNAGGDAIFKGKSPSNDLWKVNVENPYDISKQAAVLALTDTGVATSSIARRKWNNGNSKTLHHIINPLTGMPADGGIMAVTVVDKDVTRAEVLAKSFFFLAGDEINKYATENNIPALWFNKEGKMSYNQSMKPYVIWTV